MLSPSPLLRAIVREPAKLYLLPSLSDALIDCDAIIASFALQQVRRYFGQVHWEEESWEAAYSDRVEPQLKLENVAAHSWHVADAALLIAPHFPSLDLGRIAALSILHDKLEMYTGDFDPVGPDGRGTHSHAFHSQSMKAKTLAEEAALERYLSLIGRNARKTQHDLILDTIHGHSIEAQFVKAVDKLQALAFVLCKKAGNISNEHLVFSIRFSRKSIDYFSGIQTHYTVLLEKLLNSVSEYRESTRVDLDALLFTQLELDLRFS